MGFVQSTFLLVWSLTTLMANETLRGTHGGRPIARIKDNIICCPREDVHLDGWASIDVGGEVVEWHWDFNEDGVADTVSPVGEMVIAAPRRSKTYSVILRVKDNDGNFSDPDTATVYVMDLAPSVTMRSDTVARVGDRVPFAPVVRWVCASPARYEWDFDDDGKVDYRSSSSGNTSWEYAKPGRYVARFRVVDTNGREAGVTTVVTVRSRHAEPAANVTDSMKTVRER